MKKEQETSELFRDGGDASSRFTFTVKVRQEPLSVVYCSKSLKLFGLHQTQLSHSLGIEAATAQTVKNLPATQETRGLILGSGRSPGEGNGNPLQYSCLENSMDRGAWKTTVHGLVKGEALYNEGL